MQQTLGRVTTTHGTDLAFATVGTGRPIVYVGGWLSHLELSWELPPERSFYERLARDRQLVRYDRAGCGLSAEPDTAPSLERELDQLDGVVSAIGQGSAPESQPFDLVGVSLGALVAVAWAARHPQSVRRLVLYGGWARGASIADPAVRENILGIVESHWGLGSDVLTDLFAPDAQPAARRELARYQRASSSAAHARELLALCYQLDVTELLPAVRVPTLVVHRSGDRAAPLEQAESLAAGIPGARLVALPGRSHLPWAASAEEVDELVATIRRFLGLRVSAPSAPTLTPRQREVAALVAAGMTNRQIAKRLGIEERSAEGHIERIRERLGFRSRAQIAAWHSAQQLPDEVR